MSGNDIDRTLADWFESDALAQAPADGVERALAGARRRSPRPAWLAGPGSHWIGDSVGPSSRVATLGRTGLRTSMALLLLLLVLALVAGAVLVGARLVQPAPVHLGIFEPVAGRIVYKGQNGIWAVDPAASDPATTVQLASGRGVPLGWSRDGTRLLSNNGINLFILHADGSETQLTEPPVAVRGATISPDGSRVVFHSGTGIAQGGGGACCASNGLYSVDADSGPAELLREAGDSLMEGATFSPDGTRIAFVQGAGDNGHRVWVMDADGTNAHQILANDATLGAGHVRGLQWSPAGDRIVLGLGGTIYTFATDGSDFRKIGGADTSCGAADPCSVKLPKSAESPNWSPDGTQIAYTTGCLDGAGYGSQGCHLAIADADGSNVREFPFAMSGPWHPGMPSPPIEPPPPPPAPSSVPLGAGELVLQDEEVAVYADGRVFWGPYERGDYLEQRLTPKGVERLRSRVLSTGLFERDFLAIGSDVVGSGYIKVLRGDRPVIVAWGSTPGVDVSGHGLEDRWVRASSAQAAEVTELDNFLRDPTGWGLTDDMFVQRAITPFVPSHFWVSWDRGTPDWSQLPSPAREVVTRIMDRCGEQEEYISLDQAREIAQVLTQAGVRTDYDDRLGLSFSLPSSFVHAHPALPHDVGTVCGEG